MLFIADMQSLLSDLTSTFHLEISGKDDNDSQLKNITVAKLLSFNFHLDKSGKEYKEEHPKNNPFKTELDISHFDISGKEDKE